MLASGNVLLDSTAAARFARKPKQHYGIVRL